MISSQLSIHLIVDDLIRLHKFWNWAFDNRCNTRKKKKKSQEKKNVQSTNTNNARRHFEKESEQVQTPARHSGITQETIHQQVQSKIERLVILVQEPNT